MLERPGRNKAYFNTGGMVKIRFIPPRPNSELYAFFRPGQSMVNFFVSGGQSTPITLFYALGGHRICMCFVYLLSFRSSGEITMLEKFWTNAVRPLYSFETIKSTFSK